MKSERSRVRPEPARSMNVGHSFAFLGHALRASRMMPLVVLYLMTMKTMRPNIIVEKIIVSTFVSIWRIRRARFQFWYLRWRRRLLGVLEGLSGCDVLI